MRVTLGGGNNRQRGASGSRVAERERLASPQPHAQHQGQGLRYGGPRAGAQLRAVSDGFNNRVCHSLRVENRSQLFLGTPVLEKLRAGQKDKKDKGQCRCVTQESA